MMIQVSVNWGLALAFVCGAYVLHVVKESLLDIYPRAE